MEESSTCTTQAEETVPVLHPVKDSNNNFVEMKDLPVLHNSKKQQPKDKSNSPCSRNQQVPKTESMSKYPDELNPLAE